MFSSWRVAEIYRQTNSPKGASLGGSPPRVWPASQSRTSVTGCGKTGPGSKPQSSVGTVALVCDCSVNPERSTPFRLNMRSVLIGVTSPEGVCHQCGDHGGRGTRFLIGLAGITGTHQCRDGLSCGASTKIIPLVRGRCPTGGHRVSPVGDAVIAAGEIPEKLIELSG